MRALRLAWLELQRLRGPRLQWVPALLIVVPLLAGALCLLSLQDPQGRMRNVPAGIVNLDRPYEMRPDPAGAPVRLDVGRRLAEDVRLKRTFDWRGMDDDTATAALDRGDVYLVLVIPKNFSQQVSERLSGKEMEAALEVRTNDANGYLAGLFARDYAARLKSDALDVVLGYEAQQTADVWGEVRRKVDSVLRTEERLKAGEAQQPAAAEPEWAGTDRLAKQLGEIKTTVTQLNDKLADANGGSGTMASQLNDAASTAQSAQESAGSGNTALITQNTTQTGSSVRLAQGGVTALNTSLQQAAASTKSLLEKLTPLIGGSKELSGSVARLDKELKELAKSVPAHSTPQTARVQSPVTVHEVDLRPARTMARGLAPLALSLLAAVTTVLTMTMLGRTSARGVVTPARSFTLAHAGWLPLAAVSVLSTCGLFAFCQALLKLEAEHPWAALVLCALTGCAAAALGHVLKTAFGLLGETAFFLLLALQFGSAGALYPVETTNALFVGVHPWLPMTYSVEGLRVAVSGGAASHFWAAVGVLAGVTVASLGVAALCVARRRQWTGDRLASPFRDRC
ncbi:YhgE/Pip family protein [Streptomyces sp. NPDC008343]|uniref:YhgE/Pip family protein n=1 Tax=Streptomyces sp. NPDC008343 TaxID=3364828 RepID=UPI0036E36AB5